MKSPQMEAVLDQLSQELFGRSRDSGVCVTCGSHKVAKPEYFKDDISWDEWKISKMCQECQDGIWG
jgi:hypothetical protein